jgi:hypothetical protein
MSSHQINTLQYGCKCGKEFSGEPKRIKLLLKMHYKICKCSMSVDAQMDPIHIDNSRRKRNGSHSKTITGGENQANQDGRTALKSFYGSI